MLDSSSSNFMLCRGGSSIIVLNNRSIIVSILESIVQFDVANESTSAAYNTLAGEACQCAGGKSAWESFLLPSESEYMQRFHNIEDAKKKSTGDWKFRTYLPKAYTSAKSVLGTALEMGIPIIDANGLVVGKSALQAAIKAAKDGDKEEKSIPEKVDGMLDSIGKLADKASTSELLSILDMLSMKELYIRDKL